MKTVANSWVSTERRVILAFAVTVLVGVALVALSLRQVLQRVLLERTETHLDSRARVLAAQCEGELVQAQRNLAFLARLPALQHLSHLDRVDPAIHGVPEDIEVEKRELLAALMNKMASFSVLYVLRPNGDLYLVHPFRVQLALDRASLAERPYYQEAVRTKAPVISDSFVGADGILAVAILVPILDETGAVTAYLGGAFHLTRLSQLVSADRVRPFDAGFILDRKGALVAHTDLSLLRKGAHERFAASSPGAGLHTGEHAVKGKVGDQLHLREWVDPADGKSYMTTLVHLGMDWHLGLLRDRADILAAVRPAVRQVTAVVSVLFLVISAVGVAVAHRAGRRWDVAERALRDGEERYRTVVENIPQKIFVKDLQHRWVSMNERFAQDLGVSVKEAIGRRDTEFFPAELAEKYHADDRRIFKTGATEEFDEEYVEAGERRVVHTVKTPVCGEKGRVVGVLGVFWDVTEQRRMEEARARAEAEVRETNEKLARSNQELEQFAYVASHDLQEPLRMVSSYTQLLAERYQGRLDEKADLFIGYAVDGARRMQGLIEDLLTYSRVNTQGTLPTVVDSHACLGMALANLRSAIDESGAIVTNDDLPTVLADKTQLVQLFQNLIGNAVKFRKPDERPCVHIGVERSAIGAENPVAEPAPLNPEHPLSSGSGAAGRTPNTEHRTLNTDFWTFSVRDNGIGIDPRHVDRIFMIFQRLHSREAYPGTGIGLALCKRIVERHGGRIRVESEPGTGTTFHFTLPDAEQPTANEHE